MKISMIAAMANNRVIGAGNTMPWHLPADLKHFKAITMGKPIIMGRKTYQSIGKALPGRQNIVISSQAHLTLPDAEVANSCEQALACITSANEVMIIGGGRVYEQFLAQASTLYLTFIDLEVEGDTQFPDYLNVEKWQVEEEIKNSADANNKYDYTFVTLTKK